MRTSHSTRLCPSLRAGHVVFAAADPAVACALHVSGASQRRRHTRSVIASRPRCCGGLVAGSAHACRPAPALHTFGSPGFAYTARRSSPTALSDWSRRETLAAFDDALYLLATLNQTKRRLTLSASWQAQKRAPALPGAMAPAVGAGTKRGSGTAPAVAVVPQAPNARPFSPSKRVRSECHPLHLARGCDVSSGGSYLKHCAALDLSA
jgi:hypothetical protein